MGIKIIKENLSKHFQGCDIVVQLGQEREDTEIKLLQLTDMQIIDSEQRRTPDRLRVDEIKAWASVNFDGQCGNHIRSLIAQSHPDLIFITGDIVYGSFDDNGTVFEWFCNLMDSFRIPWAPVFGNHDNEAKRGVDWQCQRFAQSDYCLFKRGNVSGNGNYTIGIATGEKLVRVLHMLDSNGCADTDDDKIIKEPKIFRDQLQLIDDNTLLIEKGQGRKIPAFIAFHIPTEEFKLAEKEKGYSTDGKEQFVLGIDVQAKDGDFGCRLENYWVAQTDVDFLAFLKKCNVNAVFCGHCHKINTRILYKGIQWVFGLKTGQYDYHIVGNLGGTLITISGKEDRISHLPALVPYAPFPYGAPMFRTFFVEKE